MTNEILDTVKHHLYVCPADSVELERHILFRNFLRKNEWARLKYQELKHALAAKADQDRKIYAELKERYASEFINSLIEEEKSLTAAADKGHDQGPCRNGQG
jgi:GrpB-like predicted nucleotidyltransferase (UPF0157 family)